MERIMLQILTQEPTQVPTGSALVEYSKKSTEKNPVPDSEKYRGVIVAAGFSLPSAVHQEGEGENLTIRDADEVFHRAISEAFYAAAGEVLKEYVSSNKEAKEVPADLLTFDAIVTKMQTMGTSKRMNGEQIGAWYDASETAKDAAKRYGDDENGKKKQQSLRNHYVSLASNNPGIPQPLATKMLGYINEQDLGSNIAKQCAEKLARIAKQDTSDDL